MANKINAAEFAKWLLTIVGQGYIMGSTGQNPKEWSKTSWWFTQYSGNQRKQALYWREHCSQVFDCQGIADYAVTKNQGKTINVRARNNYSSWCDPKGKGLPPTKYRLPGTAVFWGNTAGSIHHIGYLVEPVEANHPEGDWWIVEARGVMYGVVKTKLNSRKPNWWGLMTKYFEYPTSGNVIATEISDRTLKKGDDGEDVREMQSMLIALGYSLPKYGADGDFGSETQSAIKAFQTNMRLAVTGKCDPATWEALLDSFLPQDPDEDNVEDTDDVTEVIPRPQKEYPIHALDLSQYNSTNFKKIDWQKIKDNVGFLVLRCGITRLTSTPKGVGADTYFAKFAAKCNEYDIPFWAYYYSQAKTVAKAKEEVAFLVKTAEPYNPIGYCLDCEEKGIKVADWFAELKKLTDKPSMLYIGHNWVPTYKLKTDKDGFITCADAVWIPRYGKNDGTAKDKYIPKYPCDLWQYSSVYAFDGIPDKTLDVNKITEQRHNMLWFRGES